MKKSIIDFLRAAFPFITVIILWRLSVPFWNPAGILAIIPIFYCSFVRPVPWFAPFAAVFCFLIDYRFDTLAYWMAAYCLFYAINGFQSFIDLTRTDKNALNIFMVFFGVATLILTLAGFSVSNLMRAIWLFAWVSTLYIPITALIKRVCDDR